MWSLNEPVETNAPFSRLLPERVLFEFEGPRTFVSRDDEGRLLLLHQCGESAETWRYFVVPISEYSIEALEQGRLDLRSALEQPRVWIVDLDAEGIVGVYRITNLSSVSRFLPTPGTMLYPDLEPVLTQNYRYGSRK